MNKHQAVQTSLFWKKNTVFDTLLCRIAYKQIFNVKKRQTISIHFKSYLKHSIERDAFSLAPGNIVFFKGTFL